MLISWWNRKWWRRKSPTHYRSGPGGDGPLGPMKTDQEEQYSISSSLDHAQPVQP